MEIRYITPFSTDSHRHGYPNIGGEYNQVISELPDDCWIVLRDGDTMFLTSDWGRQIRQIIEANPDYDLIGCMTNRVGVKEQLWYGEFTEGDISKHIFMAYTAWNDHNVTVKPTNLVAGLCMMFHKSVWAKVGGFPAHDIIFDRVFCSKVLKFGGKIGIAQGLYIFHLYRWGQNNPQISINHLIK
ncbi:hypothetical protein [Pedobacter africanus]|uniref:Glycosyl transferase family 2 n=1 Tax=Pedobacter africanus TaxID=151894 RepID=A0A1W1ZBN2_9SPHI|nr:hypothetical protein [Pedobacter africanus]SMC45823.1 hypothetical protein SAMN04488524_0572 [Pedobacter africanus]